MSETPHTTTDQPRPEDYPDRGRWVGLPDGCSPLELDVLPLLATFNGVGHELRIYQDVEGAGQFVLVSVPGAGPVRELTTWQTARAAVDAAFEQVRRELEAEVGPDAVKAFA